MKEVFLFLLRKIAAHLPKWTLRKLFPKAKVADQIKVDLRGNAPIMHWIGDNAVAPYVELWFEITNLSDLSVTLDRLLIEAWYGQPCFTGAIMKRVEIPARSIQKDLNYRHYLTETQRKYVQAFDNPDNHHGHITVILTAYFETKVGVVETTAHVERHKPLSA